MIDSKSIWNTFKSIFMGSDSWKRTAGLNESGDVGTPYIFANEFAYLWMKTLKKYYVGKYKYVGDVDKLGIEKLELINEYLFQKGKAAIIKLDNQYLIGSYSVRKWDHNGFPEKIAFITRFEDNRKKKGKKDKTKTLTQDKEELLFEVNKNAVIIKNSPTEYINQKNTAFTTWYVVLRLLNNLGVIFNSLQDNAILSRTILAVSGDIDDNVYKELETQLNSGKNIVKLGMSTDGTEQPITASGIEIKDRHNELINIYNFIWDKILMEIGAESNANNMKREKQINEEIRVNNDLINRNNDTEINYINIGLEKLEKVFKIKLKCEFNELNKLPDLSIKQKEGVDKNEKNIKSD